MHSRQRKSGQLRAESSADIHESALKPGLLRHQHLPCADRRRIAKRVSQSPYRFSNCILEQGAALRNLLPGELRTLLRKHGMVQRVRPYAHAEVNQLPQFAGVEQSKTAAQRVVILAIGIPLFRQAKLEARGFEKTCPPWLIVLRKLLHQAPPRRSSLYSISQFECDSQRLDGVAARRRRQQQEIKFFVPQHRNTRR